jgi:hypothetical protein
MKRLTLLSAALLTALGCSVEPAGGEATSFPAKPLTTLHSDASALTIEVRTAPEQPPGRGVVSVEYRVTDKDGAPVDGLTLEVVPWMPDMGHGSSVKPIVTAEGGGRYVVSNVQLFMPGRWELRTTTFGPVEDRATPSFQIP